MQENEEARAAVENNRQILESIRARLIKAIKASYDPENPRETQQKAQDQASP